MQFCKNGEHSSQICQDHLLDLFHLPAERKWIHPGSAMIKALQWYQEQIQFKSRQIQIQSKTIKQPQITQNTLN